MPLKSDDLNLLFSIKHLKRADKRADFRDWLYRTFITFLFVLSLLKVKTWCNIVYSSYDSLYERVQIDPDISEDQTTFHVGEFKRTKI